PAAPLKRCPTKRFSESYVRHRSSGTAEAVPYEEVQRIVRRAPLQRCRPPASFLGRVFRLLLPGASQHAAQRVVPFVARVLVEVLIGRVPRILAGPRAVPCRRILDREAVEQSLRAGAREALDDVQLVARSLELR